MPGPTQGTYGRQGHTIQPGSRYDAATLCSGFSSDSLLGMRDNHQGGGVLQNTLLHMVQRLWIQRSKTLIQDEDSGILQQCAGDVEATALAMRQLPAGLADYLPQPGRHAVEQVAEAEFAADSFCLLHVGGLGWPAAAQQQVKGERAGQDVVVMELRSGYNALPPAVGSQGLQVQSSAQEQTGLGKTQTGEEGGKGGFAAARGTSEK